MVKFACLRAEGAHMCSSFSLGIHKLAISRNLNNILYACITMFKMSNNFLKICKNSLLDADSTLPIKARICTMYNWYWTRVLLWLTYAPLSKSREYYLPSLLGGVQKLLVMMRTRWWPLWIYIVRSFCEFCNFKKTIKIHTCPAFYYKSFPAYKTINKFIPAENWIQ